MNFKSVSERWILEKEKRVKISTYCVYSNILETHLNPFFGKQKKVLNKSIQHFVDIEITNNCLSVKTIKDMVVVLKMVLEYGKANKLLSSEKVSVNYPKEANRSVVKAFSSREERQMIKLINEDINNKSIGIYICLVTGIRIGELCALTWNDIDFKKKEINVSKTIQRIFNKKEKPSTKLLIGPTKSMSSNRKIPLCDSLYSLILPLKSDKNYYVLSNSEKPIEPRLYRKYFDSFMKTARVNNLNFHSLRHTFATRLVENSSDYKAISSILGHANITTTLNLYVHPTTRQKKKIIESMIKTNF